MEPFFFLVFCAGLLVGNLLLLLLKALRRSARALPIERRRPFLDPRRRHWMDALQAAVDDEFFVLTQVAVGALARVGARAGPARARDARERLSDAWVDFLICAKADGEPACALAIEPAGKPPRRWRRRFETLGAVCQVIDLPLIRVGAATPTDAERLRALIGAALRQSRGRATTASPSIDPGEEDALLQQLAAAMADADRPRARRARGGV